MAVNCAICFLIFVFSTMSSSAEMITISHTLANNENFYYSELSKYPAKKVTLELSVSVSQVGSVVYDLDFFLFIGDFKPERNCSHQSFGQLRNEELHIPLRSGRFRFMSCRDVDSRRSCHGKTIVHDFIPRRIAFTIGFDCEERHKDWPHDQGLAFNISLYDASNHTRCAKDGRWVPGCQNYYGHTTLPNLMGHQFIWKARSEFDKINRWLRVIDPDYLQFGCHQHFHEIMCYFLNPRSDPQTEQMIPPCREACLDFLHGCIAFIGKTVLRIRMTAKYSKIDNFLNCDYLPDANGTLPCFYKPVTCPAPPAVNKGFLLGTTNATTSYPLGSVKEYVCQDGHEWTGNNRSTTSCLHSGQWSEIPECIHTDQNSINPLLIVVPLFIVSIVMFLVALV